MRRLVIFTIMLLFAFKAQAGITYYVSKTGSNTTGRTAATAFRTIQQAANVAKAGDTVNVMAGVYKEWVKNKNNGTSSARIRFVSRPRWAAKIAPTKDALAFWTSTGAYVDIEGFTIDGKLSSDLPYFSVRGIAVMGKGTRVMYNNIRLYRRCTSSLYYRGGVGIGTGPGDYLTNTGIEVFGNVIQGTRVTGCSLAPKVVKDSNGTYYYGETAGYGIYLSTPYGKVYNNIIFNYRIGIHLWHNPTNAVVSHNLVFNTGNPDALTTGVGVIIGCGSKPYVQCKSIVLSNNIFMYNKGSSVIREYGNNALGSNHILNNILYGFPSTTKPFSTVDSPVISGNQVGVNPKLVSYQANGTGDYRLTSTSPAVNRASTAGFVSRDINQGARTSGKADVGPYEYGASAPLPVAVKSSLSFLVK